LAISVWHGDPQLFPSVRATEKSDDVDSSAQGPSQLLAFLLACLGDAVGGVLLDRFREADSRLGSISKPIVVAREEVASLMKRLEDLKRVVRRALFSLRDSQQPDDVLILTFIQPVASVRSQIARIGGLARAAKYDGRAVTKAARLAFADRWTREVDPNGVLPEHERERRARAAMRAHMQRLALRSAQTRRSRTGKAMDEETRA
jgi:hypothetical protein